MVLYKMQAEDSPAYRTLQQSLQADSSLARQIGWMICDNTPYAQTSPADFAGSYVQDMSNPGLARQYNLALQTAEARGDTWLMLLDQDTRLTSEYLQEAATLAESLADNEQVVAFVPKLMQQGVVLSPHLPITLRHPKALDRDAHGVADTRIQPYNSGAVLRVSSLRGAGGFPERFWLDYLDHATFHALQANGKQVFVMHAVLEHELSSNERERPEDAAFVARQQNVLAAERAYYREYGTVRERFYHHVRLAWRGLQALRGGAWTRGAMLLKAAVRP